MNEIAVRLKKALEIRNLKPKELSDETGISRSSISEWLSGKYVPKHDKIFIMAKALQVDESWLLGLDVPMEPIKPFSLTTIFKKLDATRQAKVYNFAENQLKEQEINNSKVIPLVGKTAANPAILEYGDVDIEQQSFSHVPEGADCALNVQGDSMEPLIKDGSIVFYKKQEDVENGEIAIVEIDGDGVTCKKVIKDYDNRQVILKSINENYEDRILRNEKIRIIGKVIL